MKTSIFDMALTLPPMVVMTEVKKDMPTGTTHIFTDLAHPIYCY